MLSPQDIKLFIKDTMLATPEISLEEAFVKACEEYNVDTFDYLSSEESEENRKSVIGWLLSDDINRGFYLSPCERYILNDKVVTEDAFKKFWKYINKCEPVFFERTCCVVLDHLGFQNIEPTKLSGDGGIDFLARYEIENNPIKLNFSSVTVFGQAKRYGKTDVGIGHIRDFLGATEIIRCGGYKNLPDSIPLPVHSYSMCKPFAAQARVLIASNRITERAAEFAHWIGIRLIDGVELAQIMHHLKVGFIRKPKNVIFDSKLFEKRINERFSDIENQISSCQGTPSTA